VAQRGTAAMPDSRFKIQALSLQKSSPEKQQIMILSYNAAEPQPNKKLTTEDTARPSRNQTSS
jgi:hypothetical protein